MTHTPTAREIYLLEQARLSAGNAPPAPAAPRGDGDFQERRALLRRITRAELAGQNLDDLRSDVRQLADGFVAAHRAAAQGRK